MQKLLFALLLVPFLSISQGLKIEKFYSASCAGSFMTMYYSTTTEFNADNKFNINLFDKNNKKISFELLELEKNLVQFAVPSSEALPFGKYKVTLSSSSPAVESPILGNELEIIDIIEYAKNYKISLESYAKNANVGDTISLKFNTFGAKYTTYLSLNGFDDVVIPPTNGIYEQKFIINKTTFYEIRSVILDGECNLGDSFSKSGKVLVKTNTLTNSIEWGSQSLIVDNIKLRDTLVCSDESVAAVLKLQGNFDYNSKFKAKLFNKDKTKSYDIRMLFSNNSNDFFGLVLHELPIIESGKYYFKVSSENPIAESDFLGINISALPTFTVSTIPYFPSSDTVKLTKKDSLIFKVDITGEGPWEFNFWHKDYKASQTPFYFTDSDIKISEQPNLLWEFPPPVGFTNSGLCANKNGRSFPENLYIILLDSLITPPDKIDLSLSSSFEKKSVEKDGINQLKITLKNDGKTEATNIKVKLNIPYSPPFIMKEGQKCSNGSFDSNIWSIPSLTEGDSCVLYIDYKPVQDGVWYVEAEVMSTDQEDEDSKPNNQSQSEDDFTRNCFSIPIKFASEPFGMQLIVQDSKMDVTSWYKNGIKLNNSGNTLQITQFGTYSYEAKDFICPTQGCCPFIIEKGNDTNCCKPLEYILKN